MHNAADSLGVALGEDYPGDLDVGDPPFDSSGGLDPHRVDASREELLTYIRRLSNERARRRRARAMKIAALGASVAAAAVLIVGVVRVWETQESVGRQHRVGDSLSGLPGYSATGSGLSRGGHRVATTMPAVEGGQLVHSAYADLRGDVCGSTAQVLRGITRTEGRGGCSEPIELARALAGSPAFFMGTEDGPGYSLLTGYGRADLARIVADDSRVRIESTISAAWHPGGDVPDSFALKAFLVRIEHGSAVRFGSIMDLGGQSRNLDLTAVFADGNKGPVVSFDEALHGIRPPVQIIDPIREPIKYEDCVVVNPGERLPSGRTRC